MPHDAVIVEMVELTEEGYTEPVGSIGYVDQNFETGTVWVSWVGLFGGHGSGPISKEHLKSIGSMSVRTSDKYEDPGEHVVAKISSRQAQWLNGNVATFVSSGRTAERIITVPEGTNRLVEAAYKHAAKELAKALHDIGILDEHREWLLEEEED